MHISIAKDFSDAPWGRYPSDGDFCGETFRERILVNALHRDQEVVVDFDGVEGLGSSFLDESFGGIVRKGYFTADQLRAKLKIVTTNTNFFLYRDLAWEHIKNAKFGVESDAVAVV